MKIATQVNLAQAQNRHRNTVYVSVISRPREKSKCTNDLTNEMVDGTIAQIPGHKKLNYRNCNCLLFGKEKTNMLTLISFSLQKITDQRKTVFCSVLS